MRWDRARSVCEPRHVMSNLCRAVCVWRIGIRTVSISAWCAQCMSHNDAAIE